MERDSGLIIPKSLIKTEPRPKTQLKTSRHKRKRIESLNDAEKKLRKLKSEDSARRMECDRREGGSSESMAAREAAKPRQAEKKPQKRSSKNTLPKRVSKKKK